MRSIGVVPEVKKVALGEIVEKYYLVLLLVAILIISSFLHQAFFTEQNIMNVLASNATTAIVALGMFMVILTGGIDLSVGSIMALSCCILADFLQRGFPWWFAVIFSVVTVGVFGLASGSMVAYAKVPPFMATLAMMTIVRGIAYIYQVGSPRLITSKPVLFIGAGKLGLVPMPVVILIALFLFCLYLLNYSSFGRKLYAIGGNSLASSLSGINVNRCLVIVYLINSLIAGLAGVVLGSRLMMGAAIFGRGYELDAIASVVIGGVSLSGGSGVVINVVLGAFVFGFLANILNLLGMSSYMQMVIRGAVIIVAVLISSVFTKE